MKNASHSNHQSSILYQGSQGYVVYCYCCQNFQIAYGNLVMHQSLNDYQSLLRVLEKYLEKYENQVKPNCRCIQIKTPVDHFNLLFSLIELTELIDILNKAYLVFQAERLANDHH